MGAYKDFHRRSQEDKEGFWAEEAKLVHWHKPFGKVLDYSRQLLELIRLEGIDRLHAAASGGRTVIVLAPHFIGLNMGGIRVA